ncbi:MAG TPA: DNA-3-methyladenine glycosylase [Anditalea sp.]|nr:DNA-3-methyladenine glycosylase [Anditalea sp.]
MHNIKVLPKSFFLNGDVTAISQRLLGKILVTNIDNQITIGRIVETEAYHGSKDKACHAYLHRNTKRTSVMFKDGGRSYVYLCYGIHSLFNIITHGEGQPNAVLIRALEPLEGIDIMKERRSIALARNLCNGPGKLAQAMGIDKVVNDIVLYENSSPVWIGESNSDLKFDIVTTTRIGVDYAEEDALLPWRFYIKNNTYISRK